MRYHEKQEMTLRLWELLPMLLIGTIAPEDEKPEDVRLAVGNVSTPCGW